MSKKEVFQPAKEQKAFKLTANVTVDAFRNLYYRGTTFSVIRPGDGSVVINPTRQLSEDDIMLVRHELAKLAVVEPAEVQLVKPNQAPDERRDISYGNGHPRSFPNLQNRKRSASSM